MDKDTASWVIPVFLAAAIGGAAWYYWYYVRTVTEPAVPAAAVPAPAEKPETPRHPLPEPSVEPTKPTELRELPSLADSDDYLKLELTDLMGKSVGELLVANGIIERVVATVDNLPRDHVAEKVRPVGGLGRTFAVESAGADRFTISASSFHRYDALTQVVGSTEVTALVDLYRRYYPLFQSAYENLGYPDAYFNDRLVVAIDDMLAAPDIEGPVYLIQPHVLYEFEDPALEALSSGQKLMLRMGPANAKTVKVKLSELRNAIVGD